jgi:ABC-type Fe3+ transport system permease subunit
LEKPERPKCLAGFLHHVWFLQESSNEKTMTPSTMAVLAAVMQSPVMQFGIFRAGTPRMNEFDLSVLTKRIETQKSSTSIPTIVMAPSCFLPGQKMQMHKVSAEFAALLRRLQVTERAGGPIETHTIAIMVLVQNKRPLPLGIQASVASVEQLENGTWEAALLAKRIIRFIGAVDDTDYERGDRAAQQGSEQDRNNKRKAG